MINVEIFYSVSVPQTSTFILPTFGVPKMKIKVFVPQTPTLIQYWHKELFILPTFGVPKLKIKVLVPQTPTLILHIFFGTKNEN